MSRKGQSLTLFIILGLIIFIGIVLYSNYKDKSKGSLIKSQADQSQNIRIYMGIVKTVIDDCVKVKYGEAKDIKGFWNKENIEKYMSGQIGVRKCVRQTINEFFDDRDVQVNLGEREFPHINIDDFDSNSGAISIHVNWPVILKDIQTDSEQKMTQSEYIYIFPLIVKKNIFLSGGIVDEEYVITSGDEDLYLKIRAGTKVTDFEGNLIDSEKIGIALKIQEPDSEGIVGKTGYSIYTDLPFGVLFDPKVEVRRDFSKRLNAYNPQKSYSFWIKFDPQNTDFIPWYLQEGSGLGNPFWYDRDNISVPTQVDWVNDDIVGYLSFLGDELIFSQTNCLSEVNKNIPKCRLDEEIIEPCMCGSTYIAPNEEDISCPITTNTFYECNFEGGSPKILPCMCGLDIIYCQDIQKIPKKDLPTDQEIINVAKNLGIYTLEIEQMFLTDSSLAKAMIYLEAKKQGGTIHEELINLFFQQNPYYDEIICRNRKV